MLRYVSGKLCVEGQALTRIASTRETPFFLFSEARLQHAYRALVDGLSAAVTNATVRYCVKATCERSVLSILATCGSSVLVSHPAEAALALECAFPPDRVAYQRPVLTENDLITLIGAGIQHFHACRSDDLEILERAAARCGRVVHVSLRLRNDVLSVRWSPVNMMSRRLGFAGPAVVAAADRITRSPWLKLAAISFYVGTQRKSPGDFRALIQRALKLAGRCHRELGCPVREISAGGGIPGRSIHRTLWPARRPRPHLMKSGDHLETFARALSVLFAREAARLRLDPAPTLAIEPGRAIAGDAAVLVTRVQAVQGKWVFVDASHAHLPESPLLFKREVLAAVEPENASWRRYHLSGSALDTLDVLGFFHPLPALAHGDLLVFSHAGAYSLSRATRHSSLPPAVYLLRGDGRIELVRRPEGLADLVAPMLPVAGP